MATINQFEDLKCWKVSVELTIRIYSILNKEDFKTEFSFQDQTKRASLSISNNIAGGFEGNTVRERLHFFNQANGSVAEVKTMLYVRQALGLTSHEDFNLTVEECTDCQKLIKGLIRYLNAQL